MNSDPKSIVLFIEAVKKAGQIRCDFRLEKQSKTPLLSILGSMQFDYLANSSRDISRMNLYIAHYHPRFLVIRLKDAPYFTLFGS
jgi:hypothetical protein